MAVAFGSATTNTVTGTGTIPLNRPSGTTDGDLLILACVNSSPQTYTTPSGWTLLSAPGVASWEQTTAWWRIASSEPVSTSVDMSTGAYQQAGAMLRYTGHDASTPIRSSTSVSSAGASTTSPTSAALAGMMAGDFAVIIFGWGAGNTSLTAGFTTPSGWTSRANAATVGASYNAGVFVVDKLDGTTTSTTVSGAGHFGVSSVGIAQAGVASANTARMLQFF